MAGLHELFLHDVLDLFDVDEGLLGRVEALGHGFRDADGRSRVLMLREESLPDGDFHLLFAPRNHLLVAPDDLEGALDRIAVQRNLAGAVHQKALGNDVVVVVHEGLLDEFVQGIEGQAYGVTYPAQIRQIRDQFTANACHPGAVVVGKDLLVATGDTNVGERLTESIGDFADHELLFAVWAQQNDRRQDHLLVGQHVSPGKMGFLFYGGVDSSF